MKFRLKSKYKPAGDQPRAIAALCSGLTSGARRQTLLGVTGSGKTFAVANVIAKVQHPTLVIAHNKTLAAQLCNEFREFFPNNAVEYFVSYYDYYQPEAYLPRTDTYIEKEAMINEEIDRLRHAATQALLTRKDVIIVASVSCIYGLGAPEAYRQVALHVAVGQTITRGDVLRSLVEMQYTRTNLDVQRSQFRLRGETLEIMPANQNLIYRVEFGGQTVREIIILDPTSRKIKEQAPDAWIFPARHFVTLRPELVRAAKAIRAELKERLAFFEKHGKLLEAERLDRRTRFDLELMEQTGICHGIENYSRHLSGRLPGEPPDTLLEYFPKDFLTVIDESHVTVPQISGMYAGDQRRKQSLIEYGFRLPSAADNRPLTFDEFEKRVGDVIFTTATPGPFEKKVSTAVAEMIVRPTGLIDPELILKPVTGPPSQVDDLIVRLKDRVKAHERVMVTTLTKKMAEDLTEYLQGQGIGVRYLHSDIDTLDRIGILTDFRKGVFDVLVGVNLLREGLDLPEVTLVAILDADKEGFLRSETSLIQTIGRAARNVKGQVVLYADSMTGSMKRAIDETNRRRKIQIAYNIKHGITPKTIEKRIKDITEGMVRRKEEDMHAKVLALELAAESKGAETLIREKQQQMLEAANALQFELAAILRDEIKELRKKVKV